MHRKIVLTMFCVATLLTSLYSQSANYHLLKTAPIAGPGRWDYLIVDPDTHHVYVSHETHVVVLDGSSGEPVGDIPDTPGVHGIALAPDLGKGFISNGRGNDITIFDLKTLKTTGKAAAGENPDAIVYDPATHRVFAFNGHSNNATVIDGNSGKVSATIPLPGKPEFAAVDGKGKVYVNIEDKNSIVAIDAHAMKAIATWEMQGCESPSGLAMDTEHRRLFSVCDGNAMPVTDADSGKQVVRVKIGEGPDAAAFNSTSQLIFSSNGQDGTMTVIHEDSPDKYSVIQTVQTARGARTMAVDPSNGNAYLVTATFGERPKPTAQNPEPRAPIVPGTIKVMIFGK